MDTISADEVLATVRELFPHQYDIAALTVINRRQAARIAELEETHDASQGGAPE